MRRLIGGVLGTVVMAVIVAPVAAQTIDRTAVQNVLVAEDSRGHDPAGLTPIADGMGSPDPGLRQIAIRAAGRVQRPELEPLLLPELRDRSATIRAEAANALAQIEFATRSPDALGSRPDPIADSLGATFVRERDRHAAAVEADALARIPGVLPDALEWSTSVVAERFAREPEYESARALGALVTPRARNDSLRLTLFKTLDRVAVSGTVAAPTRRMALQVAIAGRMAPASTLRAAIIDRDEQLRRVAVTGASEVDSAARAELLERGLRDPSAIVRIAAIQAWRGGRRVVDCAPVITATRDIVMYARLSAIDVLGGHCLDQNASNAALVAILRGPRIGLPAHAWQEPAHALVALARVDSVAAAPFITVARGAARWQERMYAARAAAMDDDVATLHALARDSNPNVTEAAIGGLHRRVGDAADAVYIAALGSGGHQVVRAAAMALDSTTDAAARPALWNALERLTQTKSENTRDPRMAILKALGRLAVHDDSVRFAAYLHDYDSLVAFDAAAIDQRVTGQQVRAVPELLPIPSEPLAAIALLPHRPTMTVTLADSSGGGSFTVELWSDQAPATVARIIRLARAHWYRGHVFQRVEPDFVVQGGGPDASEYAGDDRFMRDELSPASHLRGTLGISTRGRDTGDAQWFINLVDNPRLDHDYTIFGAIIKGEDVAERIQEGDVIVRVDIEGAP